MPSKTRRPRIQKNPGQNYHIYESEIDPTSKPEAGEDMPYFKERDSSNGIKAPPLPKELRPQPTLSASEWISLYYKPIAAAIGMVIACAAGIFWLGKLDQNVERLESDVKEIKTKVDDVHIETKGTDRRMQFIEQRLAQDENDINELKNKLRK